MGSENHSAIFYCILQLHPSQKDFECCTGDQKAKIHLCYHAFPYFFSLYDCSFNCNSVTSVGHFSQGAMG